MGVDCLITPGAVVGMCREAAWKESPCRDRVVSRFGNPLLLVHIHAESESRGVSRIWRRVCPQAHAAGLA